MQINYLLDHYQGELDVSNTSLSKEKVLETLITRDAIEKVLSSKIKPSVSVILKLETLNSQLKQNAGKLINFINLAEYRENFPKSPDAWWWYLDIYSDEKVKKSHPWNRFDWLFRGVRVLVWTGNLALLGTLAAFFLSSGSGFWGAVTIAFPSILSLLQAQSELTETGKKGFDKLLERLKIPQHFHEEAKLGSSLLMTGLLLVIWLKLPSISNIYKQEGKQAQDNQKLALAEEKYLKAIELDSDNNETQIVYDGELKPGEFYTVRVVADNGVSSTDEDNDGQYSWFIVLEEGEAKTLQEQVAVIKQQELSQEQEELILAHLYRGNELNAEAIEVLEELVKSGSQTITVYQLLGDIYQQIGLSLMAKELYGQGLALTTEEENSAVKAMMQWGLGEVEYTLGNRNKAVEWLEKAKASYSALGEEIQVEELAKRINFVWGKE